MRIWFFRWVVSLLAMAAVTSPALGVVIDDFSTGPITAQPDGFGWKVARDFQSPLSTSAVVGGERHVFGMLQGDFAITAGSGDQLVYDQQAYMEVALLNYGTTIFDYPDEDRGPALNADLTAGGADTLLIRIEEMELYTTPTTGSVDDHRLILKFFSGVDEGSLVGAFAVFDLVESDDAYTLAIPLQTINEVSGVSTDWSDIDGISIDLGQPQQGKRLVIDSIETGTLLTGDLNADGVVDGNDKNAFSRFYGSEAPVAADANHDGVVDAADYTLWRDAMAAGPALAVPEPATLLLVALGVAWAAPRNPSGGSA